MGCSGKDPFEKGSTLEATIKAGKDTKIGNSAKTGWELLIPDGVMEDGTAVTMEVISAENTKSYNSAEFTLYGTPIEVSGDGAHGIWFASPIPVTIKIPKEQLKALAAEEVFFATYENGSWRYFMPDTVNMKDGTATFKASHFSILGFGKPSEEEQIKTFAEVYAADAAQAYWTQAEIEEAYCLYTKPGGDFEGDFDGIFSLKGNAEALMNIRIIKAHCAKYGIDEDDLGSAAREAVIKNTWKGLRNYFDERKAAEPEIEKLRQSEEEFIAELKKQGMLSYYDHREYFGIDKSGSNYDVAICLQRLYAIRDAVLGCIDEDKAGFFKYLRETGLYEESFTTDPSYAWVQISVVNYDRKKEIGEANKNRAGVYSYSASSAPGSYTYTWTYLGKDDYYYNPATLNGENSTSNCTWTVPPSTIKGGETVTLSLNLSFGSQKLFYFTDKAIASADFDKWDVEPGYSIAGFAFLFAYLLSFLFEGQVLYGLLEHFNTDAPLYITGAIAAHFAGLLTGGSVSKTAVSAQKVMIFAMGLCVFLSIPFYFPPSLLWAAGLIAAAYASGCAVAAWGFFLKAFTPKKERLRSCADVLIFSNLLMISINVISTLWSPYAALSLSLVCVPLGCFFIRLLPVTQELKTNSSARSNASLRIDHPLWILALFVFILLSTPAFDHLTGLVTWYWAVPYILALIVLRSIPLNRKRSSVLYVGMAMIMAAFIAFMLLGWKEADYLIVDTLMLGACGIFDLFWWSILGEMLDHTNNPAKVFGIGLSANVLGVLCGGVLGIAVTSARLPSAEITVIALCVVCVTLVLLPPLNRRLVLLLKSHTYLVAYDNMSQSQQTDIIHQIKTLDPLTVREQEVLQLILSGKSNREIAEALYISENTVKTHIRNIFSKYNVSSRVELASTLLKNQTAE